MEVSRANLHLHENRELNYVVTYQLRVGVFIYGENQLDGGRLEELSIQSFGTKIISNLYLFMAKRAFPRAIKCYRLKEKGKIKSAVEKEKLEELSVQLFGTKIKYYIKITYNLYNIIIYIIILYNI